MTWGERNRLIVNLPLDIQNWQKCYHRNQQEYIRRRLRAVKFFCEGKPRLLIIKELNITYKTLSSYLDLYIQGGLDGLVSPIVKPRIKLLTDQQLVQIKQIILTETPETYSKKDSFGL
jgi:transposase